MVACAMSATGRNSNASLLLLRIVHWSKYARIQFGGHLWVVKSAAEWCAETGLNSKQYERAIYLLRQKNLVITEGHLFANKYTTHARLTDDFKAFMEDFLGATEPPTKGATATPKTGSLYIHQETTLETTLSNTLPSTSSSEACDPPAPQKEFSGEPEEEIAMPKETHSVMDVIHGKLNPKSKGKAPPMTTKAINEWKARCGEVTGKFQIDFTMKQVGLMKQFVTACPGDPIKLLRAIASDWVSFVEAVKDSKGVKSFPSEPRFEFVHLHRDVAYNFKHPAKTVSVVKGEDDLGGFKMFKAKK